MSEWGVLLLNLGTPESPSVADVGRYLREFLLDPEVIDIPTWQRQLLVRAVIVPFRKKKSARLYRGVWTEQGSPLLVNSRELAQALQKSLGPSLPVRFAFRYGRPGLQPALQELRQQGVRRLYALPLYPQYSTSATRSMATHLRKLGAYKDFDEVRFLPYYHDREFYLKSLERQLRQRHALSSHLLFSFHGLPARQIQKNHPGCGKCFARGHCDLQGDQACYQRQCRMTAGALADRLGLKESQWSLSYQSRLGRNEWLLPSTEQKIDELLARGVKELTIANPGFSADCLETIEEAGELLRRRFEAGGGHRYTRIECLNADPFWVEQLSQFIQSQISEEPHGKTPSQPSH